MSAFHRPTDLTEALAIAAGPGVRPAAGCTDLFPATEAQVLAGPVLDLTAISGLRGIARDGKGWRIGAVTTWADVIAADLPPAFDGLKAAAREVGSVQIQTSGTVAGNLCNASPAADGVPPLLTLGAEVEIASATGMRRLPLGAFLTGVRQTALAPGEIVTAILIPEVAGQGAFLKLGARRYLVISIAMVAVRLVVVDGRIAEVSLAVGACSPVAQRLSAQEAALAGLTLAEAEGAVTETLVADALSPIADVRADAAYRIAAATDLVRRAVAEAGRGA
ncbi:xanthine dehydrogenase [Oceanicola sp. 22II-s10i]|uniref:FAD binding domain-containing protein n=1 Tax=Oceanicola sp. 22II-s10i TaxID=1317116 RepID=UPI000B5234F1|nr:FAD binding domain-containing protein [Oceanicola sp. 22II-s10i]OWU84794.1 xanthine dehydrogenase [Oceanicola sp. 22II-s10i]